MHRSVARRKSRESRKCATVSCRSGCVRARRISGTAEWLLGDAWPSLTALRNMTLSFSFYLEISDFYFPSSGPDSSVGIATDYGLDGPGIESRWGRDFPPVQTGPGAHPASCTMGTGSFPGGKVRPGCAADHSPPSSAEVVEE